MNIALILTGHLRTFQECKKSIENFVLGLRANVDANVRVDVYICVHRRVNGYHPYVQSQLGIGDYENNYFNLTEQSLEKIFKSSDNESSGVFQNIRFSTTDEIDVSMLHTSMQSTPHAFGQYRAFQEGLQFMKEGEQKNNIRYTHIIKGRSDNKLILNDENIQAISKFTKSNENTKNTKVLLDNSNTYPNDHFIFGEAEIMLQLPSFILNEYIQPTSQLSLEKPPHGLLEHFINTKGLKVVLLNISKLVR